MRTLIIYEAEAKDGLTELIEKNSSLAYVCKIEPCEDVYSQNLKSSIASAKKKDAKKKKDQKDDDEDEEDEDDNVLYFTKSILVSTNWNKNDDIFLRREAWAARHTPRHKPTNIEHNRREIVGHITDTWVIDFDGNIIPETTSEDDLPDFHICNAAVIYRYFPKDKDLQERAETLIEQIEAGEKYVSMECLFPTFDYALHGESEVKIVKRNAESAFLTKHLRAYGGTGQYGEYKIGRVLRNIEFSGKGYVDKPANPNSIIFDKSEGVSVAKIVNVELSDVVQPQKIETNAHSIEEEKMNELELQKAQDTIAELKKANKELSEQVASFNTQKYESQIEALKAEVAKIASVEEEKATLAAKLVETEASLAAKVTELDEVTKAKADAEAKIAEAEKAAVQAGRTSILVDGGLDKTAAEASVTKFAGLNDEQFEEVAKALIAANKPVKTDEIAEVTKQVTEAETKEEVVVPVDTNQETTKLVEGLASLFASQFGVETQE